MIEPHAELEVARRYVARQLDAADATSFEDHLVGCERCQAEVRLSLGLRRVAGEQAISTGRTARLLTTGALLLAAAVAAILIVPSGTDRELSKLGRVTSPPAYIAMSVRSSPAPGDSLFASAMVAYNEQRYSDARAGLRAALAAGVDSTAATFFLASSALMTGRPREAVAAYGRVIASGAGASGYLEEAHLYRAYALLQLGRGAEALSDLSAVVSMDGTHREAADTLASRLNRVTQR